jgi:hypothetical protein
MLGRGINNVLKVSVVGFAGGKIHNHATGCKEVEQCLEGRSIHRAAGKPDRYAGERFTRTLAYHGSLDRAFRGVCGLRRRGSLSIYRNRLPAGDSKYRRHQDRPGCCADLVSMCGSLQHRLTFLAAREDRPRLGIS